VQPNANPKLIRCAIYTRKSTEEGLDQDFNSLDAQRECAEAYISSQRQEQWVAVARRFDDGGFTGSNIDRPALKDLLSEIEAGRIDCVIVYKVDRLSRSLLDFARIMEVLDKRGVSFVSVTQQLNSSSPMGRLTLNVLLSFAQFEREIISERTRDKMSAARRKGKWTGGTPVLGYDSDAASRKLVINEAQAAQVRAIFELFLDCRSLGETLDEIERRGWKNKTWTTRKSKHHAGGRFTRPTLISLLSNVIYVGDVRHKGAIYPGEHEPIVSREVWKRAKALLDKRKRGPDIQQRMQQGAILQGLIDCALCGHPMVAGYAMKRGRRYSFYVCQLTRKRGTQACPRQSISARLVERAVSIRLYELAANDSVPGLATTLPHASWESLDSVQRRQIIEALIDRVSYDHREGHGALRISLRGLESQITIPASKNPCDRRGPLSTAVRADHEIPSLARLMALAIHFDRLMVEGKVVRFAALARMACVSTARISQVMKLLDLAPSIQGQLLFAPPDTLRSSEVSLRRIANEPDWQNQEKMFQS
jgi:DNA invertase Pin-like site-specific DNA recombinase